ncbi:RNA polymerase III transcription factor [Scheffersomyces amazonensis]|uniref:RNA polymerase III transcription factor n=1 Tax=Scheffersomyces amazonensis TaxID=1078765 RepID=UPI00315DFE9F
MSFNCPPSDLVSYVLETLSFSGTNGCSLSDMWTSIASRLNSDIIDEFQKQIIWQWLFFSENDNSNNVKLYVTKNKVSLIILPNYSQFIIKEGDEKSINVMPTDDTQWRYLTGLEYTRKARVQLGDKPFELLCEIAKSGPSGILSADLCRATGQDPKSLTLRFKKLQDAGLIVRNFVYDTKSRQHTSLLIHSSFAKVTKSSVDTTEEESFRNVVKARQYIVQSVKTAPNNIRSFRDLKRELNLHKNRSSSKFFGSIIESLHRNKYVERIMVKSPDDERLIYSIKYLRDLPKDPYDLDVFVDVFNQDTSSDDVEQTFDLSADIQSFGKPLYNSFFPITNQIHQLAANEKSAGLISSELLRNLTGVSTYRPFSRLLENITSFNTDGTNLKPLKKYPDEYVEHSVVRMYDNDGKFKYYKYYTKPHVNHTMKAHSGKPPKQPTPSNKSLQQLNEKEFTPLEKIARGDFATTMKRKSEEVDATPKKKKKASTPKSLKNLQIDMNVDDVPIGRKRGRPKKVIDYTDSDDIGADEVSGEPDYNPIVLPSDNDDEEDDLEEGNVDDEDEDVVPKKGKRGSKAKSKTKSVADTEGETSIEQITTPSIEEVVVESVTPELKPITVNIEKISHKRSNRPEKLVVSSLKSARRRSALIDIIRQLGGVTYTTAKLRRSLDDVLGSKTTTDLKTLARDISSLIATGELIAEEIEFSRGGQDVTRKILILTDERYKPTKELIDKAKSDCITDNGGTPKPLRHRVVESEVTFYNMERPSPIVPQSRLSSLSEKTTTTRRTRKKRVKKEAIIEEEPSETNATPETLETPGAESMSNLVTKKYRGKSRPKKKTSSGSGSGKEASVRARRRLKFTSKFDKSDATTLFRSIVISKTLKRGPIDFEEIADLFDGIDAKTIKQKWTVVRKSVGGLAAVSKGMEDFERIIIKGIDDELVSAEDLQNLKFTFFLDLWKDADGTTIDVIDKTPLYFSVDDNLDTYNRVETGDNQLDLYELLEDNSMRQKELLLAGLTFFDIPAQELKPKENDHLRTVLKAIFSTSEESFSMTRVSQLLSEYGDDVTLQTSTALMRDREMVYAKVDDSTTRFVLTDKVSNALAVKLGPKFLKQAASFKNDAEEIFEASKGLILSQGISNGQMASLLSLLSSRAASMTHIDKTYVFEGYESRLIDKEKLACDIVIYKGIKYTSHQELKKVSVPTGKACSHIWIDLDGNINNQLWIKIIVSILYYIHFRPGIPRYTIQAKLQAVLGHGDFQAVMDWLLASQCIHEGLFGSYWVDDSWYTILGV